MTPCHVGKVQIQVWSWPNPTFHPHLLLKSNRTSRSQTGMLLNPIRTSPSSLDNIPASPICTFAQDVPVGGNRDILSPHRTCQIPTLPSRTGSNATSSGKTHLDVWALSPQAPLTLWIFLVTFIPFCQGSQLCSHLLEPFIFSLPCLERLWGLGSCLNHLCGPRYPALHCKASVSPEVSCTHESRKKCQYVIFG